MINLKGQVAIITGGAQGIGEGVCKVFCDAGATVALWDVRDSGAETAAKLKAEGGKIFFQKVDITNREVVLFKHCYNGFLQGQRSLLWC